MEAFGGPPKTMTTEMLISQHQGQNNADTIGDMTLSKEFEVFLNIPKLLRQLTEISYFFPFCNFCSRQNVLHLILSMDILDSYGHFL